MFTDFCDCARRHPESAVNELDTHRPMMVVITGLIDEERTISGLFPVALIASPILVFKKKYRKAATAMTAVVAMISLLIEDCPILSVTDCNLEKTVEVLFMLSSELPPIIPMFTEYSAVFIIIPARRLSTPIFV